MVVSDLLEKPAPAEDRKLGNDLADCLAESFPWTDFRRYHLEVFNDNTMEIEQSSPAKGKEVFNHLSTILEQNSPTKTDQVFSCDTARADLNLPQLFSDNTAIIEQTCQPSKSRFSTVLQQGLGKTYRNLSTMEQRILIQNHQRRKSKFSTIIQREPL